MSNVNQLAKLIFNNNKYPAVKLPSIGFVESIIENYMRESVKLSQKTGTLKYYSGVTEAEKKEKLGNIFFKITYMAQKGIADETQLANAMTNFDVNLRDQIWIIISQIMQYAQQYPEYVSIWKPSAEVKTVTIPSTSAPVYDDTSVIDKQNISPVTYDVNMSERPIKKYGFFVAIGLGALLLMGKKRRR